MRVWSKLSDEALGPNLIFAFSTRGGIGAAAMKLDEAELEARIKQFPLLERRNVIAKIARGDGYKDEEFTAAREKAEFIVERAERALQTGPYLACAEYSLADINMIPFIDRFKERIIPDRLTPRLYPRTCDWYDRVMARPKVRDTFTTSEKAL